MKVHVIVIFITTIFLFVACDISSLLGLSKEEKTQEAAVVNDTNIYIQKFSFETKHNNQLPHGYDGVIVADTITIKIPQFYLTEYGDTLIPTIKGRYAAVHPEDQVARRFNSERTTMTYSISNADGFIKTYRVIVEPILNSNANILNFVLERSKNSQLHIDYKGIIDQEQRKVVILMNNEILQNNSMFVPTIEIAPGATITPDINTSQDFSTSISYTIVSEDGTTQRTYEVSVTPQLASIIHIDDIALASYKRTEYASTSTNVKELKYHAERTDDTHYTFYIPPAEYQFFSSKHVNYEFDFKYPTKFEHADKYYPVPHTYEILAKDGITKKNITVDIQALPEPVKIVYYNKEQEIYFPYDLTKGNTITFPTLKFFNNGGNQASKLSVFFLKDSITDIEATAPYFSATTIDDGIYTIASFENKINAIPAQENVGEIIAKNNDKEYILTINSNNFGGRLSNLRYIKEGLYNRVIKNNIIKKLDIELQKYPFPNNLLGGTESFHVTATITDYYDIVAPTWPPKSGTYEITTNVMVKMEFQCRNRIQQIKKRVYNVPSVFNIETSDESTKAYMNHDKTLYISVPVSIETKLIDFKFTKIMGSSEQTKEQTAPQLAKDSCSAIKSAGPYQHIIRARYEFYLRNTPATPVENNRLANAYTLLVNR